MMIRSLHISVYINEAGNEICLSRFASATKFDFFQQQNLGFQACSSKSNKYPADIGKNRRSKKRGFARIGLDPYPDDDPRTKTDHPNYSYHHSPQTRDGATRKSPPIPTPYSSGNSKAGSGRTRRPRGFHTEFHRRHVGDGAVVVGLRRRRC